MAEIINFEKTKKGNDPADHVDDHGYEQRLRDSVLNPNKTPLWLGGFRVSNRELGAISDPEFIIDGLVVAGHLILVAAEPNGGKTTIFMHLSGEMVRKGFHVIYVNADISGGDAKGFGARAEELGVDLLLPDMKVGKSMADVVAELEKMNREAGDYSGLVFVFDTLKKMADVISKRASKDLLRTLRGLTARGATIILLAHTNKYKGDDGKPIYEGTGDLRSDVDELIYLIPEKHSDGSMTVSVEPDKTRAKIKRMTFDIGEDRTVTQREDYVDLLAAQAKEKRREMDQEYIERITEAIEQGLLKQSEIVEHCKSHQISRRQALACLKRYSKGDEQLWVEEKGFARNVKIYALKKGES
jgi:hypothetical protein